MEKLECKNVLFFIQGIPVYCEDLYCYAKTPKYDIVCSYCKMFYRGFFVKPEKKIIKVVK
jgi:hypothetical protein